MTKTIRTCDRCKKTVAEADDLNTLKLVFTNPRVYSYSSGTYTQTESTIPEVQWCKDCCTESGFVQYKTDKIVASTPSFEEMLREMVASIVQEELGPR